MISPDQISHYQNNDSYWENYENKYKYSQKLVWDVT